MPLRVARPDRRWKGCGENLVPEPVWCEERQQPAGHCAWGMHLAADTRPGTAVTGCLECIQPRPLDIAAVWTCPSIGSSLGSHPWLWRRAWIFTCCMCCAVYFWPEHGEQDISPRPPNLQAPPDSSRRRRVLPTFPPMDPENTSLSATSHTFLF